MQQYHIFIGIDIGKFNFVVSLYGKKDSQEYDNTPLGHSKFIKDYRKELRTGLCILETTGGCEHALLFTLCQKGFSVHRANTRHVKNFIRSLGQQAKTDSLDAQALALYGYERHQRLDLFVPQSPQSYELFELIQRRNDLKQMLVAEKNRLKSPRLNWAKESVERHIALLSEEIEAITNRVNLIIEQDKALKARKEALKTVPGIGDVVANELLVLMPELGSLTRRQAASLCGVAPRANDSGKRQGYRSTGHGRNAVKPMLFLAAMAARNSKTELGAFYQHLLKQNKKKMVALVAVMRKIIVIANARLRDIALEPSC